MAGELYLKINGLKYQSHDASIDKTMMKVYKGTSETSRGIYIRTPQNSYYSGEKDFLLNLGYLNQQPQDLTLEFLDQGDYTFESIEVYVQSMENYPQYIDQLKENVLDNIHMSTNQVTGTITVDQNKFLCLTIPYSQGWKAYVDGKEVTLYQANTMYMGIDLVKGEHQIELRYTTPGLKVGIVCSLVGCLSFMGIVYFYKKRLIK